MRRKYLFLILAGAILLLGACGPALTIQNNTGSEVRVVITIGGNQSTVSPEAAASAYFDTGTGSYTVTVIANEAWLEYARGVRDYLAGQLSNPASLTPQEVEEIARRLTEVQTKLQEYQAIGASCSGVISLETFEGMVTVGLDAEGRPVITCQ